MQSKLFMVAIIGSTMLAASPASADLIQLSTGHNAPANGIITQETIASGGGISLFVATYTAMTMTLVFDDLTATEVAPDSFSFTGHFNLTMIVEDAFIHAQLGDNTAVGFNFEIGRVGTIAWQNDFTNISVISDFGPGNFFFNNVPPAFGGSRFQFFICPQRNLPCGSSASPFTIATNLTAAAVPGPVVGAGIPGLLLASLGWLGWRRRARQQ